MSVLPVSAISEVTAKSQAKKLAEFLRLKGLSLNHSTSLEAIAVLNGHKSWNHMSATFSAPATAKVPLISKIEAILKNKVESRHSILSDLLADLVPQFRNQFTFEYSFSDTSSNGEPPEYSLEFYVVCKHDPETSISLGFYITVSIDSFESVVISPNLAFKLDRAGFGPATYGGHREDSLEFHEVATLGPNDDISLDVTDLSLFESALNKAFSEFNYKKALIDAISPDSIEEMQADFSKPRIPGIAKEDLHFGEPEGF